MRMRLEMVFALMMIVLVGALPAVGTGNAPPWLSKPVDNATCWLADKTVSPGGNC